MLREKILSNEKGILLYGLTPPKLNLTPQKLHDISNAHLERISRAHIDGLVIYDLQDESLRTEQKRTFEFTHTIDPLDFYKNYLSSPKDAIIYRAVGKYNSDEFKQILSDMNYSNISCVFVGASSKDDEMRFRLNAAYDMRNELTPSLTLGGICIPERHTKKQNEHLKIAKKCVKGCKFFITQAVYDAQSAKAFIDDYAKLDIKKVPIIFTFTPCGNLKTLEFMKWLGINIPQFLEERLKNSFDILSTSIGLAEDIFEFIYKYASAKGISVGANIESVSTRKVEIEASMQLLNRISGIIKKKF